MKSRQTYSYCIPSKEKAFSETKQHTPQLYTQQKYSEQLAKQKQKQMLVVIKYKPNRLGRPERDRQTAAINVKTQSTMN